MSKQREKISARIDMIAIHKAVKSHAESVKLAFEHRRRYIDEQIGKLISERKQLIYDNDHAEENIDRSNVGIRKLTSEIERLNRGPISLPRVKVMETPKQKVFRLKRKLAEAMAELKEMGNEN